MAAAALTSTDVVIHTCEDGVSVGACEDARLCEASEEEALPITAKEKTVLMATMPGSFAPAVGPSLSKPRAAIVSEVQARMRRYLTGETAGTQRSDRHATFAVGAGKRNEGEGKADLFRHVLGIVNPGSGEHAASSKVADAMRSTLGRHRVLLLNGAVFRDPSALRDMLKRYAVVYFNPINGRNMDDVLREEAEREMEARAREERKARKEKRRKHRWGRGRSQHSSRAHSSGSSSCDSSSSSSTSSGSTTHSNRSRRRSRRAHRQEKTESRNARSASSSHANRRARVPVIPEKVDTAEMRGTVFVSGGDGTMAFILEQVERVRQELLVELCVHNLQHVLPPTTHSESGGPAPLTRRLFATPAVAPIPLGTGNDFSNCLGFGSGFTKRRPGVAGWLCCAHTDVVQLMEHAAAAPAVPFDRWRATFVPLRVAQQHYRHDHESTSPVGQGISSALSSLAVDAASRPDLLTVDASGSYSFGNYGSPLDTREGQFNSSSLGQPADLVVRSTANKVWVNGRSHSASFSRSGADSGALVSGGRGATCTLANRVHNVDWDAVREEADTKNGEQHKPACTSYGIINYLGIGFDAYVACKFDETRKKYPQLCSTRVQNKAVYGFMGLRGSMKCKSTRKLLPMVCVPRPSTTLHTAVGMAPVRAGDSAGNAPPPPATTALVGKPDMVALSIPEMTKALVMTNVNSYSAGAHPWDALDPEVYYEPIVGIRDTNILTTMPGRPHPQPAGSPLSSSFFGSAFKSSSQPDVPAQEASPSFSARMDTSEPDALPVVTPVAINDRRFELQAMGGVLHYGAMGAGLTSAVKMAQPNEMFIFVLCTPDDLGLPVGVTSLFTQTHFKGYEARIRDDPNVKASLHVQIDGEALPRIEEPTIIHVEPIATERVFVRCTNTDVIWQKNDQYRALVEEAIDEQTDA